MKILHVVPWLAPRYGGPATLVPQAAAALTDRGHSSEVISTNVDGLNVLSVPVGTVTNWAGATVTFHPVSRPASFLTSWPMYADLRRRASEFDVVHIHCLYRFHAVAASIAARRARVPYVIQAHGALDPWHRARRRRAKDVYHAVVEDRVIGGAAAIVCTSAAELGHIRELGYTLPGWIVPAGVPTAELRSPGTTDLLTRRGIGPEHIVVTYMGRIAAGKGVPTMVEAFRRLTASHPLARLVVAGPDDRGIGRTLASGLADDGLAERVAFVGPVTGSERRGLLQRSQVFVLPSAGESFGLAVAEAMAVGCPVVITPGVAIKELVQDAGAGIVADANPDAIAGAVDRLLRNHISAAQAGTRGRRLVDERLAWPTVSRALEAMYEAVSAAHLPAASRSSSRSRECAAPRCIGCGGALKERGGPLSCSTCGWRAHTHAGVPILLDDPGHAEHDELDHHARDHKAAQASHFDRTDQETFEINRPHDTPRLYRFFLSEKFRRAVEPVRPHLAGGASALVVCGGSGMDAEYLSRTGACVITSDLSLGAALRARSRSETYELGIESLVADVEKLPFGDRAVDLVAVHDGLHHLADPYRGLDEMARVAKRWIVVTEPAQAALTRLAVRLGLALEREEAGNRVARLDPGALARRLATSGFTVVKAERYAMYYPHHPGRVFALLSTPFVYPVVRHTWRVANALIGRWGNKMVVVAERLTDAH